MFNSDSTSNNSCLNHLTISFPINLSIAEIIPGGICLNFLLRAGHDEKGRLLTDYGNITAYFPVHSEKKG